MFKCCSNPKVKVINQHIDRFRHSSDTHTALVSCESCGKTKYTSNKTSSFQWAIFWAAVLFGVLIFIGVTK